LNHQLIADEGHGNAMTLLELEQRMRLWLSSSYQAILFHAWSNVVAYGCSEKARAGAPPSTILRFDLSDGGAWVARRFDSYAPGHLYRPEHLNRPRSCPVLGGTRRCAMKILPSTGLAHALIAVSRGSYSRSRARVPVAASTFALAISWSRAASMRARRALCSSSSASSSSSSDATPAW